MSSAVTERDEIGRAIAELTAVAERRDLSVEVHAGAHSADIAALLATFSSEFVDYRGVVTGVRDAVRRTADMLRTIMRATVDRSSLAVTTAEAVTAVGRGALQMADDAAALHGFSQRTAETVNEAAGNLEFIDGSLSELSVRLAQTDIPLVTLRQSTDVVGGFVLTLARLSRHAQLLAVNASIEAAYLDEAGTRFAIVAQEVRNLSTSTRDAKADVAKIVAELRETSRQISASTADCQAATGHAALEITGAAEALQRTANGIEQFESIMANFQHVTDTQSIGLEVIGASLDEIAYEYDAAAKASQTAEQLDLDALLARVLDRAGRWKPRPGDAAPVTSDTVFGRWIEAIRCGADPAARGEVDDDAALRPLVDAVRSLVVRVNAEHREILGAVVEVGAAMSLNGHAWQSISATLDAAARKIDRVRTDVAHWTEGAIESVQFAQSMQAVVIDSISDQGDAALKMLDGALELITRTNQTVNAMDGSVELLNSAAQRAGNIMALIETLSSETDLLSLNAAIEAARAGSEGLGFGVIAEEIRSLARSTNEATTGVSTLVDNIAHNSSEFGRSIGAASKSMKNVVGHAEGARKAIAGFRSAFDAAISSASALASIAAQQQHALDRVSDAMARCASAANDGLVSETAQSRLDLAICGSRAHAIAGRRAIGTAAERVRRLGETLCERVEATVDQIVTRGKLRLDDLFRFTYRELQGDDLRALARLIEVSAEPPGGLRPGKFATPWDGAIDEALIGVLSAGWDEAAAADLSPIRLSLSDLNGFIYAVPRQSLTGRIADDGGARIKQLLEDDYAFRVSRWGLGPQVAQLGARSSYEQFREAGCLLDRPPRRPWGAYVNAHDPTAICNELALGVYFGGRRHGTLRFCYDSRLL